MDEQLELFSSRFQKAIYSIGDSSEIVGPNPPLWPAFVMLGPITGTIMAIGHAIDKRNK